MNDIDLKLRISQDCAEAIAGQIGRVGEAAIDNKHYLVHDGLLNQYDTIPISIGMTLSATDVVSVYAGTATVAFNLFGAEITA